MHLNFVASFLLLFSLANGNEYGVHKHASTIRPPAFPLAVRSPYVNVWQRYNTLNGYGNWATFRNGADAGWTGIARVDGKPYTFMGWTGNQNGINQAAKQQATFITPTQTVFIFQTGPVELQVTFLSPVELGDLKRQSIPMSYVFIKPRSIDGALHNVQVYIDITGQWVTTDLDQEVKFSMHEHSNLKTWKFELVNPKPFQEYQRSSLWGAVYFSTSDNAQHQSGPHIDIRDQFSTTGQLDNSAGNEFRCIRCNYPVLAFVHELDEVGPFCQREMQFAIGHARQELVNLHGVPQNALWTHYFTDELDMISFFYSDIIHAKEIANALDDRLLNDAYAVGGQDYADIISLSLRQAVAATEFSGTPEEPLLYLDNGRVQTVDVIYSTVPMWHYLNVTYLQYLLEPLFQYENGGFWTQKFSMRDIGVSYPNVAQLDKSQRIDMPIEETANMILLVADLCLHPSFNSEESQKCISKRYSLLIDWADYLHKNCLRPAKQLITDKFIRQTELNSGLALKGILAMKAFAKLAKVNGEKKLADFYNSAVQEFYNIWVNESFNKVDKHLEYEYGREGSYQLKHDAFQDKLLNLGVISEEIYKNEATYYIEKSQTYGISVNNLQEVTKSDWEMWTAAAFGDYQPNLKVYLLSTINKYLHETTCRNPFSDWYNTASGGCYSAIPTPVVGGHFALLALKQSN